jgi:hypothetical protein
VRQGYKPDQIAVLTPYVGQLLLIRKKLSSANMIVALDERDLQEIEAKGGEIEDQEDRNSGEEGDEEDEGEEERKRRLEVKSVTLRERIRLATVDNFQGEEAEVVIISTVRNNTFGRTGFLKIGEASCSSSVSYSDPENILSLPLPPPYSCLLPPHYLSCLVLLLPTQDNRVNVMLSRAKHGMYILGSKSTLEACRSANMFNGVLRILQRKQLIGTQLSLCCTNHQTVSYVKTPQVS